MSLNRIWMGSPNYSSRGGATVRLIVIHSSEGAQSGSSLGSFFANPSSGVSSHTGIDATPNTCYEYVRRDQKAWTASSANPVAVQTELCTPSGASASFTAADWQPYLPNLAQWIREESGAFGIPMVRLTPAQAQGSGRGICEHQDLGSWGGGHVDCGPNLPWADLLALATGGGTAPTPGDDDLPLNDADKKWITDTVNNALRQQFAPDGECFSRVVQADQKAIAQTPANVPK